MIKATLFAGLLFASTVLAVGAAAAQPFPFNAAGVTNPHWHLNSKDVAANEKIFVATGGKAFQAGGRHRDRSPA